MTHKQREFDFSPYFEQIPDEEITVLRPCNPEQLFRAGTLLKLEMSNFDDLNNFLQITVSNSALILDLRGE